MIVSKRRIPRKKSFSGKFVIRVDPNIHSNLSQQAELRGISLNDICVEYLKSGLVNSESIPEALSELIHSLSVKLKKSLIGVLMFGSQARGDTHDNSDTDILVVLSDDYPILRDLYREIHEDKFSLHFTHLPESANSAGSIWLECAIDGKILYDPSQNVRRMLSKLRGIIAKGKVVRKETHGQGYWVYI